MLSEAEIGQRMPVWVALSDLFLDTEQDEADYRRIADILSASGYSRDELRRILVREVTPAFAANLFSVAGEWAGWPEEFIRERIMRVVTGKGPMHRLKNRFLERQFPQDCWVRIDARLGR